MNETLRKRLTGALVLIALGILLPFALSQWLGDPAPVDGDGVRVYEITPQGQAIPVADPEPAAPKAASEKVSPAPAPAAAVTPLPEDPESPPAEPESEPVTAPPRPESPSSDTNAGRDEPAAKPWTVQIGSFRSEENARRLVNELAADFPAFYGKSEVNGVVHYRVRIGPYAEEGAARRVAETLIERGRNAQVRREP